MATTVTYKGTEPPSRVRAYRDRHSRMLLRLDTPTEVADDVAKRLRGVEGHRFEFSGDESKSAPQAQAKGDESKGAGEPQAQKGRS